MRLHPETTKVVHCKDSNSNDQHPNVLFDFLGHTFRARKCLNPKTGQTFCGFTPAVSRKTLKIMYEEIEKLHIQRMSAKTIADIAAILKPRLPGWISYYGRFTPSALARFFYTLDRRLLKWARVRYKRLRTSMREADNWLSAEAKENPNLLAH